MPSLHGEDPRHIVEEPSIPGQIEAGTCASTGYPGETDLWRSEYLHPTGGEGAWARWARTQAPADKRGGKLKNRCFYPEPRNTTAYDWNNKMIR